MPYFQNHCSTLKMIGDEGCYCELEEWFQKAIVQCPVNKYWKFVDFTVSDLNERKKNKTALSQNGSKNAFNIWQQLEFVYEFISHSLFLAISSFYAPEEKINKFNVLKLSNCTFVGSSNDWFYTVVLWTLKYVIIFFRPFFYKQTTTTTTYVQ